MSSSQTSMYQTLGSNPQDLASGVCWRRLFSQSFLSTFHLVAWMGTRERVAPGDSYGEGFFEHWAFELAALNAEGCRAAIGSGSPFVPVDLLG